MGVVSDHLVLSLVLSFQVVELFDFPVSTEDISWQLEALSLNNREILRGRFDSRVSVNLIALGRTLSVTWQVFHIASDGKEVLKLAQVNFSIFVSF